MGHFDIERRFDKIKLQLLDTPGILRPREDQETFLNLAFIGTINDDVLDVGTLASDLIEKLVEIVPEELCDRFKIDIKDKTPLEILENIAAKRGWSCRLYASVQYCFERIQERETG